MNKKCNCNKILLITLLQTNSYFQKVQFLEMTIFYFTQSTILGKDIDEVLFSETMRDLDLMVSTSYVGGVDPESSHSTVEMRIAIAKELTGMLSLSNVSFLDRHAKIEGKLGEYSVHMGSGVVHVKAKGMLPIVPVHSQHRGRIFLPFADDDPKTAEIMTKILLLANDQKIKDPEILKYLG